MKELNQYEIATVNGGDDIAFPPLPPSGFPAPIGDTFANLYREPKLKVGSN